MKYIVLIKYGVPLYGHEKNFHMFSTLETAQETAKCIKEMRPDATVYVRELTEDVEF